MSNQQGYVTEAEMELAIERKSYQNQQTVNATALHPGDTIPPANSDGDYIMYDDDDAMSDEYVDEIYDIVDAVVSKTDDPTLPALTLR
ncbi:hypothetical protein HDV05_003044, partial [Chytridiales sp. JEL 0842]